MKISFGAQEKSSLVSSDMEIADIKEFQRCVFIRNDIIANHQQPDRTYRLNSINRLKCFYSCQPNALTVKFFVQRQTAFEIIVEFLFVSLMLRYFCVKPLLAALVGFY